MASSAALGAASGALTVNKGVLDLAGFSPTVSSLSGSNIGFGIVANSNTALATLTLAGTAATTFLGTIQDGAGKVQLQLSGNDLTLAGTDAYSGGTYVSSGTLSLDGAAALLAGTNLTIGSAPVPGAVFSPPSSAIVAAAPAVAPVPEPSSVVLLAIVSLFGVVLSGRRAFRGY